MKKIFSDIDKPLFVVTMVLFIGGLLILASASMVLATKNGGTPIFYVWRQLAIGGGVGLVGFIFCLIFPYRYWKRLALPLMLLSFILLALLFIPKLSYTAGGARRWLTWGSFSFQPSEFLKLAFIVYLASWLDARRKEIGSVAYGMIPFALMLAIVGMFLVMQPDIGTLGVVIGTAVMLYFLGGGPAAQIGTLIALGGVVLFFLIQIAPYRLNRVLVFWNPGTDPQGIGYQITQALIAIGSGGFWGEGFGRGIQKFNFLPEPMGDSIFAVFLEEMGFFGALFLIGIFIFFLWRVFFVAKRAPDTFGKLLASGIGIGIVIQAFINMAAISGLMPLTGIPLPFISYGGTSLAMALASVGIILNISKQI